MNPLTINMEFSYEYTINENTENIPLNLEPKQNALFPWLLGKIWYLYFAARFITVVWRQ